MRSEKIDAEKWYNIQYLVSLFRKEYFTNDVDAITVYQLNSNN